MLSIKAKNYLKEVFGYNYIKEVDNMTIECIKENIEQEEYKGEYFLDREILKEFRKFKGEK